MCLVSAIYNSNLQLQMLGPFVVVFWLYVMYYKLGLKY